MSRLFVGEDKMFKDASRLAEMYASSLMSRINALEDMHEDFESTKKKVSELISKKEFQDIPHEVGRWVMTSECVDVTISLLEKSNSYDDDSERKSNESDDDGWLNDYFLSLLYRLEASRLCHWLREEIRSNWRYEYCYKAICEVDDAVANRMHDEEDRGEKPKTQRELVDELIWILEMQSALIRAMEERKENDFAFQFEWSDIRELPDFETWMFWNGVKLPSMPNPSAQMEMALDWQ